MKINEWIKMNVTAVKLLKPLLDPKVVPTAPQFGPPIVDPFKKCLVCQKDFVNDQDPDTILCSRCEDLYFGRDHAQQYD